MWLPLVLSMIIVCLLTLAEVARGGPRRSTRLINLQAWLLVVGAEATMLPLLARAVPFSLVEDGPWWLVVPLFFVAMDLGEYLFHRAQHAVPWLWRMHSLHHSDEDMNATTTVRHFWGDALLKQLTIWPLAMMIVRPSPLAASVLVWVALWNFATHSSLRMDFGRWSWLLNSSAYHRRHHSILPEHYNSNFAAMLPIWDVILGSYHRPEGYPPTGLAEGRPQGWGDLVLWPLRGPRPEPAAQLKVA